MSKLPRKQWESYQNDPNGPNNPNDPNAYVFVANIIHTSALGSHGPPR
jgi:hypothetical protein